MKTRYLVNGLVIAMVIILAMAFMGVLQVVLKGIGILIVISFVLWVLWLANRKPSLKDL